MSQRFTEKQLLKGLDSHTAHADELASPSMKELGQADSVVTDYANVLRSHYPKIQALVAEHGCFNVRVFGSVSRDDNTSSSDINFLVDTAPNITLLDLGGLQVALEELLSVSVNLRTPGDFPAKRRSEIIQSAKQIEEL